MGLGGEVGVIAFGKLADIVIWNYDPLDITVLQRPSEISTIIKDGRVVDRAAGASATCQTSRPVRARRYRASPA
jgi:imidazolonepropionase-like amidohydrolase